MVHLDEDYDPDQLDFDALIAEAPRVESPGDEAADRAVSFTACGAARQRELILMRSMLLDYLRRFPIGREFQAIDFNHWLDSQREQPDEEILDRRCTGGLFRQLVNAGILAQVGFRNNGGDKARGYNGTPRTVYAIASHDFASLGWIEEAD